MSILRISTLTLGLLITLAVVAQAEDTGRIYGKIQTVDGDVFEGLIRWDKNEGGWVDVLDGDKNLPKKNLRKSERKRYRDEGTSIKILGLTLGDKYSSWSDFGTAQSGIRFGHIKSLEVVDDDMVLLTTKSGIEVELEHGSTDIGKDIREIIIEDNQEGEIELVWDDIESITFLAPDKEYSSNFGDRLYGTLTTRRGETFNGFVCWDIDELFTEDILDGDERNRKRKIPFGKIASIERYSSSGATVKLVDGDEMLLRESNDIDDGNRGIIISDPAFGQVRVNWDEFEKLDFSKAPGAIEYGHFDGGQRLYGTVYTEDGQKVTGEIRWDNDEEYTWEILDGDYHDIEFDIEFGLIKEISKRSYRSCDVTVSDGRTFRLRGSNDIDEDNKGVFVTLDNGEEVDIDWEDFEKVEFTRK
ncbi:MAG: hypothetical protein AB1483_10995 [Candidatus Zixiibacteriota bacterium]